MLIEGYSTLPSKKNIKENINKGKI